MSDQMVRQIVSPGQKLLQSAVFGLWEDLCGPSVKCRFTTSTEPSLTVDEARSLVKIALSYHLKDSTKFNHFNVCDFGDLNMSGFNCVYTAPVNKQQMMFCILAVFPRSYYCRLRTFTNSLALFWQEKMEALRVHHFKAGSNLEKIIDRLSKYFAILCNLLERLENNSHAPLIAQQPVSINFKDTFIQRCIASHLITFGRSLVLGESTDSVNHMIRVLSLFSLPHRQELCVDLPKENDCQQFHAELFVQGNIHRFDEEHQFPITVWDILKAKYPITIINVTTNEVHCSVPLLIHNKRRNVFLSTAISRFIKNECVADDVFESVDEVLVDDLVSDGHVISKEVEKICGELMLLNGEVGQIVAVVSLFMRQMVVKAKILISFISAWEKKGDSVGPISKRSLWSILNVHCDGDYLIVQALGEQLRPGLIDVLDRGMEALL